MQQKNSRKMVKTHVGWSDDRYWCRTLRKFRRESENLSGLTVVMTYRFVGEAILSSKRKSKRKQVNQKIRPQ